MKEIVHFTVLDTVNIGIAFLMLVVASCGVVWQIRITYECLLRDWYARRAFLAMVDRMPPLLAASKCYEAAARAMEDRRDNS